MPDKKEVEKELECSQTYWFSFSIQLPAKITNNAHYYIKWNKRSKYLKLKLNFCFAKYRKYIEKNSKKKFN